MTLKCLTELNALINQGWLVRLRESPADLPPAISSRYNWLPNELTAFLRSVRTAVSPAGNALFVTCTDLSGEANSAFSWDEWEQISLVAAQHDLTWQDNIRRFWNVHFPIFLSVKAGYAYAAVRPDLKVVIGEEPEFEETEEFANDFSDFLRRLTEGHLRLGRMV